MQNDTAMNLRINNSEYVNDDEVLQIPPVEGEEDKVVVPQISPIAAKSPNSCQHEQSNRITDNDLFNLSQ